MKRVLKKKKAFLNTRQNPLVSRGTSTRIYYPDQTNKVLTRFSFYQLHEVPTKILPFHANQKFRMMWTSPCSNMFHLWSSWPADSASILMEYTSAELWYILIPDILTWSRMITRQVNVGILDSILSLAIVVWSGMNPDQVNFIKLPFISFLGILDTSGINSHQENIGIYLD